MYLTHDFGKDGRISEGILTFCPILLAMHYCYGQEIQILCSGG